MLCPAELAWPRVHPQLPRQCDWHASVAKATNTAPETKTADAGRAGGQPGSKQPRVDGGRVALAVEAHIHDHLAPERGRPSTSCRPRLAHQRKHPVPAGVIGHYQADCGSHAHRSIAQLNHRSTWQGAPSLGAAMLHTEACITH